MLAHDHYAALGVAPGANADEIDTAYRHLCRRYHPDVNPGDAQAAAVFDRVQRAYRVLNDPAERAAYDHRGAAGKDVSGGGLSEAPGLSVRLLADHTAGGSYAELFRWLQQQARRARPAEGEELHVDVIVPLEAAETGKRVAIATHRRLPCQGCHGRGRVRMQHKQVCGNCEGTGEENFAKGALSVTASCSLCGGHGVESGLACDHCGGRGTRSEPQTVLVRVPAGVIDGQLLRVPGGGHFGERGGKAGDLVARCTVSMMPGFERDAASRGFLRTVSTTTQIGLETALLGGRVAVRSIDGDTISLRIPPGTQNGQVFRLRGRGLELLDGHRGDMLVRVDLRLPRIVDEESKDLIRQFARRNPSTSETAAR